MASVSEYVDQATWYELYELHPEAGHVFRKSQFVKDFDTWEEAEEYAVENIPEGIEYRIKRVRGLDD